MCTMQVISVRTQKADDKTEREAVPTRTNNCSVNDRSK